MAFIDPCKSHKPLLLHKTAEENVMSSLYRDPPCSVCSHIQIIELGVTQAVDIMAVSTLEANLFSDPCHCHLIAWIMISLLPILMTLCLRTGTLTPSPAPHTPCPQGPR